MGALEGQPVALGAATASDGAGNPLTPENDAPAQFPPSTTPVVWTATDAFGQSSSCTQHVVVFERPAQRRVGTGGYNACEVRPDLKLACWGDDAYGQATPPTGVFTQVSAGERHSCGVRADASLACWGSNDDWNGDPLGQATPPAGAFTQVSVGYYHTCGLRSGGAAACWGSNGSGEAAPPAGTFTRIAAGAYYTCGLKSDGGLACWGYDNFGQATAPAGSFREVTARWQHGCGLRTDGTLACWGDNGYGQATPPDGEFSQVSAGGYHTCGVTTGGQVLCWGGNASGQAPQPVIQPATLAAGRLGTAYARTLSLADATGPYLPPQPRFELAAGSLPNGLSLDAEGLLSGTPETEGSFGFTVAVRDGNGFAARRDYVMAVALPDTTAPVVTPTVTGTLGANGWYRSNVTVNWSVTDPESRVTSQTGCDMVTVSADTSGQTYTCTAVSGGGSATQSVTIKRDATPPVINLTTTQDGQSYLRNSSILADYACSDGLSGVATCAGPVAPGAAIDTAAVGAHAFTVAAADQAGNQAAVTHSYSVAAVPVVLNVNRTGEGGVISDPAGINCGSQCRATFARGTNVVLAATPAYGYRFAGWSGGVCSGTGPCGITLDGNRTVTANFTPIPRYGLVVIRSGSGTVTSSPAGINCGRTCGAQFYQGTAVTLTATPAAGRRFAGWSGGGCSGTGTCTVTMNRSTQVRATFR
ncbi:MULTISPECIES: InlB B-repeat-containing protein [Methylococcus]|uniref:non-specific serine/threonine protein kinase n=1 Tax=Methylococcus capsulatus TaxID=414 RepID=A0ABZ2F9D1_METCP|nr:putative Ig domain-containing protein [Methylococcus capsulatus]